MNRNLEAALAMGTTVAFAILAAVAIVASGAAFADDITVDNTSFVGSRSRADVKAELMNRPELVRAGASEWAIQRSQAVGKSGYTSEQAKSEYKAERQFVNALNAEDSGSAYLAHRAPPGMSAGTAMGGPARR